MIQCKFVAAVLLAGLFLTACSGMAQTGQEKSAVEGDIAGEKINNNDKNTVFEGEYSIVETQDLFSDRDLSGAYDEDACETITLRDGGSMTESKGVKIDGDIVTIKEEGVYLIDGALANGMVIVDADKDQKVQLVLNGVDIKSDTSAPIYVKQADKVFVTLADKSENMLANGGSFVEIDENHIDAVIFSKDDLTLNGTGSLTISTSAGHGVVSKDDLVITGGNYEITAASHGLSGKDSVAIADGSFRITAGKDAVHSANDDDDTVGWVYIADGTFFLEAESDGIEALNEISIVGGTLTIAKSYEGLEARLINISGGTIDITASDDGLNATDKRTSTQETEPENAQDFGGRKALHNDANIYISNGVVRIDAEGDGIDSNGHLTVSGGEIYVLGSSSGGDGALDYDLSATITGGIVVAAGQSAMAVNFGGSSTQGSILINSVAQQQAGTDVILLDANGEELLAHTIGKGYNSVVVSCPAIAVGETYTLKMGTEETQITMDGLIYGEGHGPGGFGGGHGGMKGGTNGMRDDRMPPDGERPPRGEKPDGRKPE